MKTKPSTSNHSNGYGQTSLNVGFNMADALKGVTDVLEMAILRVVIFHVGRENIISRTALVEEIHAQGFTQDERTIRLTVSEMRRKYGIPLAGTGGVNGGYWILKNEQEKNDYVQVQLRDPGTNLLEQASAIEKSFYRWYPGSQYSLSQAGQQ